MNGLVVVGCAVGGAGIGAVVGAWWGFAMDAQSDLKMAPVFTTPIGALVGGFAGVIAGVTVFA